MTYSLTDSFFYKYSTIKLENLSNNITKILELNKIISNLNDNNILQYIVVENPSGPMSIASSTDIINKEKVIKLQKILENLSTDLELLEEYNEYDNFININTKIISEIETEIEKKKNQLKSYIKPYKKRLSSKTRKIINTIRDTIQENEDIVEKSNIFIRIYEERRDDMSMDFSQKVTESNNNIDTINKIIIEIKDEIGKKTIQSLPSSVSKFFSISLKHIIIKNDDFHDDELAAKKSKKNKKTKRKKSKKTKRKKSKKTKIS